MTRLKGPRQREAGGRQPWSPAEELRLRELAGKVQVRELARMLSDEFGVPRTKAAVSIRGRMLDISLWWGGGYSQMEVARIFGVWFRTVERWRDEGLLQGEAWEVGRGRFGQWHITEAALAEFVDQCTWAYALETMPAGPWRTRALVAHRADPWLTIDQLAELWRANVRTVRAWAIQGRLPHRRRRAGTGMPKIVVRAADLPGLRQELRAQSIANIRTAIAGREARKRERQQGAA